MKLRYLFLIAILFALCPTAKAACSGSTPNYTAASSAATDVNACITVATHCGDIITVPSGTSNWGTGTAVVNLSSATGCSANQGITLQGATVCTGGCSPGSAGVGLAFTDNTVITLTSQNAFQVSSSNTAFVRVTGFTFAVGGAFASVVQLQAAHAQVGWRFDHNHITNSQGGAVAINANLGYGLVDHYLYTDTATTPGTPIIFGGIFSTDGYTDWADATTPGSNQSVIVEDSQATFTHSGAEGFFDGYYGCKMTIRYNIITGNQVGGWHGTDSGGFRGCILGEIYNNTISNSNGSEAIMNTRSGVLLFLNNAVSGNLTAIPMQDYRLDCVGAGQCPTEAANWGMAITGVPWTPIKTTAGTTCGSVDCISFVTANAPDWQASHAYTCSTSTPCVVAPLLNNTGAGGANGGGYNYVATVSGTSSGTEPNPWNQTVGSTQSDGSMTWTVAGGGSKPSPAPGTAAGFQTANPDTVCSSGACARYLDVLTGYPLRDQPGFAHNQVSTPNYSCNNTLSLTPALLPANLMTGDAVVQSGRDFFNATCPPSYTPYTYPDPLQNAVSMSPSANNFGSVNVGSSSAAVTFTLTNNSGVGMTAISASFTGGNSSDFSNTGAGTCSTTLSNSASCTYTLIFSPSGTGARATTFSVSYSGGDGNGPQTSALSGTGVGAASPVAHCPKCFMAVNVEPLPATAIPTLTNVSHPATYLTSQGFTQNGTTFSPTLSETLTGTGFGATTECFWDATIVAGVLTGGTQVPCSCGSPTSCTATISASLVAIPSTNTSHMLGVSNPTAAVPILQ